MGTYSLRIARVNQPVPQKTHTSILLGSCVVYVHSPHIWMPHVTEGNSLAPPAHLLAPLSAVSDPPKASQLFVPTIYARNPTCDHRDAREAWKTTAACRQTANLPTWTSQPRPFSLARVSRKSLAPEQRPGRHLTVDAARSPSSSPPVA